MINKFENRKLKRPFILDGAIGSLIQQKGSYSDSPLWSSLANLKEPDVVQKIHEEYILAGADIITTNTFRTNPVTIQKSNLDLSIDELVRESVDLLKKSPLINNKIIAGSNAPAEDCYQKERMVSKNELEYNHKKHIELLWDNGSDIILNETQSHLDEIEIICEFCAENKIPFIVSFYFSKNLNILSGEPLASVIKDVLQYFPAAIGFNCINSQTLISAVEKIELNEKWGYYINCGSGDVKDKNISCGISPTEYLETVKHTQTYDPYFVGACCGSSPQHIRKIKDYFDEIY